MRGIKGSCFRVVNEHFNKVFAIWSLRSLIRAAGGGSNGVGVIRLLSAALLAVFLPVSAQPNAAMEIISHTPLANKLDVERSSAITAVFSSTLDSSTVSAATFSLRGEQTGPYEGMFSFPAGDQLRFTPAQPFKPGETLYVTGSSGVLSAAGEALKPYTWQFTAEAGRATGEMRAHPSAPSFGAGDSWDVALGDLDGDSDLDAVVANVGQAQTVWLNDGSGAFSAHPEAPSFGAGDSLAVALGDLDGDGDLDAVVANPTNQAQTVWLNSDVPIYLPLVLRY